MHRSGIGVLTEGGVPTRRNLGEVDLSAVGLGLGLGLLRRSPLATFEILFLFAGHRLESTLIPLELAFEHRNYLPSLGLILAAADLIGSATGALARFRPVIAALGLLALFSLSFARSWVWGGCRTDLFRRAGRALAFAPSAGRTGAGADGARTVRRRPRAARQRPGRRSALAGGLSGLS